MALDLANGYQRKDSASASNVYYAYTYKSNATDSENVFAIRKVSTVAGVETVTWTNGDPISYNDNWTSRTYSFSSPGGSLGLTGSTGSNLGYYYANFSWNLLSGVSKYMITANGSGGVVNTFGQYESGPNYKGYTNILFNTTSWSQVFINPGTYTFTVIAQNVAGSTSSTITIKL